MKRMILTGQTDFQNRVLRLTTLTEHPYSNIMKGVKIICLSLFDQTLRKIIVLNQSVILNGVSYMAAKLRLIGMENVTILFQKIME